jgi:hypothetical protein
LVVDTPEAYQLNYVYYIEKKQNLSTIQFLSGNQIVSLDSTE